MEQLPPSIDGHGGEGGIGGLSACLQTKFGSQG